MSRWPKRTINGWLVVDKPEGLSSAALVAQAKRAFQAAKVGHAGTLDPLASGILPLAFGEATKVMPFVLRHDKGYDFTIIWGTATTTDDREGTPVAASSVRPTLAAINAIVPRFTGVIQQVPPAYSALKIAGRRACDRMRNGESITLPPRPVVIHSLVCTASRPASADFSLHCGSGTYVRALARDIAVSLGTTGHVGALRRTMVSGFTERACYAMETILAAPAEQRETLLQPLDAPLDKDIPVCVINVSEANALRHGQRLHWPDTPDAPVLRAYAANRIVGLVRIADGWVYPLRVFNLSKEI